jgi:Kef-type K+ transport system membrane component KefB
MSTLQAFFSQPSMPVLLLLGAATLLALFAGKGIRFLKLPSLLGFMFIGVILGPSLFGAFDDPLLEDLTFLTRIALGFVALSIGLELSFGELRRQGRSIVSIILAESCITAGIVIGATYLLTGDIVLALFLGGIAPASAPLGTVAVIQEYRAKGPLTRSFYSVIGFDDGVGIILYGFASAVALAILGEDTGAGHSSAWVIVRAPLIEIGLSFAVGAVVGGFFSAIARALTNPWELSALSFATVMIVTGLEDVMDISLILTLLLAGIFVTNTQPKTLVHKTQKEVGAILPLLFLLFFLLAGANLHLDTLPAMALLALGYTLARTFGKIGGAWFGAVVGRAPKIIKRYVGFGILSQAGVAIGLALVAKRELTDFGTAGVRLGGLIITLVTATSVIFELMGPLLTRMALRRAGEIDTTKE